MMVQIIDTQAQSTRSALYDIENGSDHIILAIYIYIAILSQTFCDLRTAISFHDFLYARKLDLIVLTF